MRPGRFVGKLVTFSIANGWEQVIQTPKHPFYYVTSYGRKIHPRNNFITDLGSSPRFLWIIIPPHYLKPPVVCHDWDYDTQTVPRWQADMDLCEMIYTYSGGNAIVRRNAYWSAIRTCGWLAWRRDTNAKMYDLTHPKIRKP